MQSDPNAKDWVVEEYHKMDGTPTGQFRIRNLKTGEIIDPTTRETTGWMQ